MGLVVLWLISPSMAYNFSELIEAHAVDTYAQFLEQNEDILKQLPPPKIARDYYEGTDMYLFDQFQTGRPNGSRRPRVQNMYDVFCNIRDDEGEHVNTMKECQLEDSIMKSPELVNAATGLAGGFALFNFLGQLQANPFLDDLTAAVEGDTILDILVTLLPFF